MSGRKFKNSLIKQTYKNRNNLLLLEHDKRIQFQIRHVNCRSFVFDVWMFLNHKPSHMRKKNATRHIVRIGISVCIFVMYTACFII